MYASPFFQVLPQSHEVNQQQWNSMTQKVIRAQINQHTYTCMHYAADYKANVYLGGGALPLKMNQTPISQRVFCVQHVFAAFNTLMRCQCQLLKVVQKLWKAVGFGVCTRAKQRERFLFVFTLLKYFSRTLFGSTYNKTMISLDDGLILKRSYYIRLNKVK